MRIKINLEYLKANPQIQAKLLYWLSWSEKKSKDSCPFTSEDMCLPCINLFLRKSDKYPCVGKDVGRCPCHVYGYYTVYDSIKNAMLKCEVMRAIKQGCSEQLP